MAFTPDKWADGEEGGTPITAEELNRIESAGEAAAKTATWGQVANRPSAFTPSGHTHSIEDIDSLETSLTALLEALNTLEARVQALEPETAD